MNHLDTPLSGQQFPGKISSWQQQGQVIEIRCENGLLLRVEVVTETIIRFRYATEGYFPRDFSYAIDPKFTPAPTQIRVVERDRFLSIRTRSLDCRLNKENLSSTMRDSKGRILLRDDKGFHWERSEEWGSDLVFMSKQARSDESYFGLGDKSCHLNMRGERLENWVTDCFGYSSGTDPLYRAIPFYYGLHDGRGYGIFFDNSFRTFFDFAKERKEAASFWAHGGEMNYYFIYGPELMTVAESYTQLTGRPELPPLWAMGFHQCKWSYFPESRVREIAGEFRSREIPCDAIYLDIDYMDGYRCFTWHPDRFPNPEQLIADLRADGFRTIVIIDPGIKIDPGYQVYEEGLAGEHYLRRPDGPYAQGKVWPGDCYFPDYTRPETRDWWAGLFRDLMRKQKVDGVWNDMNEPAIFEVPSKTLPLDVRFDYDGNSSSHRKAHNIYGMQMARATLDGVKDFAYPKRPFLITRATFAGGQRYSSVWTGDNVANWEHLQLANTQCQRLSVSGFSHCGSDIGGFNDQPDGELFVRWLQTGIFHPLCRVHSIGFHDVGDAAVDDDAVAKSEADAPRRDQEPWSFGEPFTSIAKQTIELRYRLLPYLYTTFWQYSERGTPFLRPLSFVDQTDSDTLHRMEEFMVGDQLLVIPISKPGVKGRFVYLPKGLWYDFRDEKPILGEQEVWTEAKLSEIPIFVKAGAVLPLGPVMQYTGEKRVDSLELHLYYLLGRAKHELYQDSGEGYGYQEGAACLRKFSVEGGPGNLILTQETKGTYAEGYQRFQLHVHALPFVPKHCLVDGEVASFEQEGSKSVLELPASFSRIELS